MTIIVTSGSGHIDIDALACAEAYGDYLGKRGDKAMVLFTPSLNATVPPMLRKLPTIWKSAKDYALPDDACDFVVMDVSNPDFFDPIVNHNKITEVFDHHYGFESHWNTRHDVRSWIVPVGACATIVWEKIKENGHANSLNATSYKLLLAAIVSNTLNFRSRITTARDISAYEEISGHTDFGSDGAKRYFEETSSTITSEPTASLLRDEKYLTLRSGDLWIGQIEIWDARSLMSDEKMRGIQEIFSDGRRGFANIVSISEGVNYIVSDSTSTIEMLKPFANGKSIGNNVYRTYELWLRKELVRELASANYR